MTVSSQFAIVEYAGDGSTTPFSTWNSGNGFAYENTADVKVYLRNDATGVAVLQTITTHYTLSASGLPTGGTCTMVTAPALGETLVLVHDPVVDQQADYVEAGKFPAETHERALDRLTHIALKLGSDLDRSLKLPDGSAATGSAFDANSNRIENVTDPTGGQDVATKAWTSAQIIAAALGGPISIAATNVSYDNSSSGLAAALVQAAIDEVEARLDTAESGVSSNASAIAALPQTIIKQNTSSVTVNSSTPSNAATNLNFTLPGSGGADKLVKFSLRARILDDSGSWNVQLAILKTSDGTTSIGGLLRWSLVDRNATPPAEVDFDHSVNTTLKTMTPTTVTNQHDLDLSGYLTIPAAQTAPTEYGFYWATAGGTSYDIGSTFLEVTHS